MPSRSSTLDWESLSLRLTFTLISAVAVVFLVAPSVIVILTSLTASQSLRFPPEGLSLRWYAALLNANQMQHAAWTSLVVAFWATLLCAVLGTAAALAISRSNRIWARFFDLLPSDIKADLLQRRLHVLRHLQFFARGAGDIDHVARHGDDLVFANFSEDALDELGVEGGLRVCVCAGHFVQFPVLGLQ